MRVRLMLVAVALILAVSRPAFSQEWIEFASQEERLTCLFPTQPKVTETTWVSEYGAILPARVYSATQGQSRYSLTVVDYNPVERLQVEKAKACPAGLPDGTKYFSSPVVRRNPQLGSAGIFFTSAVNSYNGIFVDVNRRFRNGFALRTNYTYGQSLDNSSAITGTQAGGQVGVVMDPEDRMRDYGLSTFDVRNRFSLSGVYELPIGTGKPFLSGVKGVADKLVSGWQLNAIVNVQSGFPFTPILGFNQSRNGDTGLPDRPNWAPGRTSDGIYLRTPEHWVDATAFALPAAGTYGNVGRNVLTGPGLTDVDMSMFKTTRLTERSSLQFRAEAFNLLNRSNFGLPNLVMLTPSGAPASSAGAITTTATTSRQIQLGLKVSW